MSENNKGLLSICCLGYNHAKFAEDNLSAIWASTYKNIEIIVVDDGSTDNSVEVLTKLKEKSPIPVKLILQKNTGNIGKNFNNAIKAASGEFIVLMSLDDVLYSDKIAKNIHILEEDPKLMFVASSKITGINEFGTKCYNIPPLKLDSMEMVSAKDLLELEYAEFGSFYIQGVYFRKSIIDAVGGFDEDMTGDDIILRTKIFKYLIDNPALKFSIEHETSCYYRRHENNISNNNSRQLKIVSEYLQKYWPERDNPQIFTDWTLHTIKGIPFAQAMRLFSINQRMGSLLLNEQIINNLKQKAIKENSCLNYIYKKEKIGYTRVITLFSFIRIKYKKQ